MNTTATPGWHPTCCCALLICLVLRVWSSWFAVRVAAKSNLSLYDMACAITAAAEDLLGYTKEINLETCSMKFVKASDWKSI